MKIYHILSTVMIVATTSAADNQNLRGAARSLEQEGTFGPNSCEISGNYRPCFDNKGSIGEEACQGGGDNVDNRVLGACQFNTGTIGNYACTEHNWGVAQTCSENSGTIKTSACRGKGACQDNRDGTIEVAACEGNGERTCRFNYGTIGGWACKGDNACYNNLGTIGDWACKGDNACSDNRGTIEDGCCVKDTPSWIPECNSNDKIIAMVPGTGKCEYNKKKPGEKCSIWSECLGGNWCEMKQTTASYIAEPDYTDTVCCSGRETIPKTVKNGGNFSTNQSPFCKN